MSRRTSRSMRFACAALVAAAVVASGFSRTSDVTPGLSRTIAVAWSGFSRTIAVVGSGFSRTLLAQSLPKEAVFETSLGTFIIDLTPDTAPNQAAYFMKTAQ